MTRQVTDVPKSPLSTAVYRGDIAECERLLASGADANERDRGGLTLLMRAIMADHAGLPVVALLLRHGADVNATDTKQHWTALHFASRDRQAPIVAALLEAGASVEVADSFGNTPLWRAVMGKVVGPEVVKHLLAAGANPDSVNSTGVSPRSLAAGKAEISALFNERAIAAQPVVAADAPIAARR